MSILLTKCYPIKFLGKEKVLVHNKPYCLWLKNEKKVLDRKGYGGAVLIDLLKAFDAINHILLAKQHAHGFTNNWFTKVNKCFSSWSELF